MKFSFFAVRLALAAVMIIGLTLGISEWVKGAMIAGAAADSLTIARTGLWAEALGTILVGAGTLSWVYFSVHRQIEAFSRSVAEIAEGKLTHRVRDNWVTAGLAAHVNRIVTQEKKVICEVAAVAQKNKVLAEQLSRNIELNETTSQAVADTICHIAENASNQAEKSYTARMASQEMAEYAAQIASDAEETLNAAKSMTDAAANSQRSTGKLIEQMNHTAKTSLDTAGEIRALEEEAHRIDTIVSAVTDISQRTNLLALNAAIEAARAGDAGKGFAVVADEVRKLAEQSSQSAYEINRLLEGIVHRINEISERAVTSAQQISEDVASADESRAALETVDLAIKETVSAITRIRGMADRSSGSAEKVDTSMDEMNSSIQQTAAGAEEVSASAQEQSASMHELSTMASTLNTLSSDISSYLESFIASVKIGDKEQQLIRSGHQLLQSAAEELVKQGTALDKASDYLRSLCAKHPAYEYLGVMDTKGDMVSANIPLNGRQNYSHRPYFKEAMNGKAYCSEPYISNVSFNYCLALAVPVRDRGGNIVGVFMADLCIED